MYDELYNPISYEWGNITDKEEIIRILNTYIDNYFDVSDKEIWFNNIKELTDSLGYCSNMKEYKNNPDNYTPYVPHKISIIYLRFPVSDL